MTLGMTAARHRPWAGSLLGAGLLSLYGGRV
jgi:hypothetical protein